MKNTNTTLTTLLILAAAPLAFAGDKMDPGDTELTPKELKGKSNYFLKFDADGDQQLSADEYTEMVRSQFEKKGKDGHEPEAAKRMERRDLNDDGYVSFAEHVISPEDLNALNKEKRAAAKKH
jgi:Ca2+-binding EF-hand superfamily protein